jgi:hypothetical protein
LAEQRKGLERDGATKLKERNLGKATCKDKSIANSVEGRRGTEACLLVGVAGRLKKKSGFLYLQQFKKNSISHSLSPQKSVIFQT